MGSSTKRPFQWDDDHGPISEASSSSVAASDQLMDPKRQKLPSAVVEAVKIDSLQKLFSNLEPILRKVVGEEVERALARLVPSKVGSRTPPRQPQELRSSDLRLTLRNKLSLPLFTGGKIEGDQGLPIHIVLEDAITGEIVTTGPESAAKLQVVVLDGDFGNDEDEWTAEDFENHVVKERDGKRPLLTGDLTITLKEGVGTLGELTFTDNSSWIRSRKFRLGVRVIPGYLEGIHIQECRTEPFTVKDHRGELYKKHYPPSLNDEVWRLDKIGKDGAFHKRLQQSGIKTVQDFLRTYMMDEQKLRNILGSGMSNKMWDVAVEHAKTCVLSGKLYVFYADNGPPTRAGQSGSSQNIGVIFNHIYELMGVTFNGQYKSVESLMENEKVMVDKLVKVAYENWENVSEYDSSSLSFDPAYKLTNTYNEDDGVGSVGDSTRHEDQPLMYNSSLVQAPKHSQSLPAIANTTDGGVMSQLYDYSANVRASDNNQVYPISHDNQMLTSRNDTHNLSSSPNPPLYTSFGGNDITSVTGLAIGPHPPMVSRSFGFQPSLTTQQSFQQNYLEFQCITMTPDQVFSEDDIRAKAQELMVSDDIQQLLRLPYGSSSFQESYRMQPHDSYIPAGLGQSPSMPRIEDGVARPSGKAYVGWLKLKAALRWGIFIRKIVHEKAVRRAQIEELED